MMPMTEISSAQNLRYKTWLRLLDGRGIKKHGQALVSGRSFIQEILDRHASRVEGVIVGRSGDLEGLKRRLDCPLYLLPNELFAALDIYGIKGPILQISAPPLPDWAGRLPGGLTVFVPFQNPINLGTAIRSAAAFDAGVVLLREAATPYLPKALRASGPGIFQVPLAQGPSLGELAELELPVYALSPRGRSLYEFDFAQAGPGLGLVAGLEGPGLDAYWPEEKRLSIPMNPQVESLNASVSLSIAMAFYRAAKRG